MREGEGVREEGRKGGREGVNDRESEKEIFIEKKEQNKFIWENE